MSASEYMKAVGHSQVGTSIGVARAWASQQVHLVEVHWLHVSLLQSLPSSLGLLHLHLPSGLKICYPLKEVPEVASLTGWSRMERNHGTCWTLV